MPTGGRASRGSAVTGISLSGVATTAFGGFYIASRRARATAASFLLTFLVTLPFVLTIEALAGRTTGSASALFDDFRNIVGLIVAFYFASEAAVSGLKVFLAGREGANLGAIQRADRDLAPPPSAPPGQGRGCCHNPAGLTRLVHLSALPSPY